MDERSSLLGQLRIDHDDRDTGAGRPWAWWVGACVLLIAIGVAGVLVWRAQQGVPVSVVTAEAAPTDVAVGPGSILDASGYVVARRKATVSSKITGKVVDVLIEEGQRVERDEIIARLDDTNARAAVAQALAQREQSKANLVAAQVAFVNAVPTYKRNEQQLALAVISAQSFDTAKANYDAARTSLDVAVRAVEVADANLAVAQRSLDDTVVRAPFAGIVTVKAAQEGEMVSPNSAGGGFTRTGIGTIVDMSSLEVEVDVSENFINRVRPGQAVTVKLNAYPDWEIAARVIAIIPTADRAKATVKVRVGFDVDDARILPEMGARVAFLEDSPSATLQGALQTQQRAVIVPVEAVQGTGDTGVVFLIENDVIERRTVRLGARSPAGQVVLAGLAANARLAVGDFSLFTDGARVRIAN